MSSKPQSRRGKSEGLDSSFDLDSLRGGPIEPQIDYDPSADFVFDDIPEEKRFLGMTAVERMFLSIFLFMNVLVIGVALLLATGRLVL
ncbi:MAG: hypothetical protein JNL42_12470 [Anaerolineae bacterium]|nr:hypothetical protein [Anaerolineae bacterium]